MTITIQYEHAEFDDQAEMTFEYDQVDRIEFKDIGNDDEIMITVHQEPKETDDGTYKAFRAKENIIISSESG